MTQQSLPTPSISVIIPTFRRPERLAACLRALASSNYPRECLEVLVVDDGGGVPLEPAIAPLPHNLVVTVLVATHGGPAAARNLGIAVAHSELLAFTDDDCLPDPGWLSALAARHRSSPDALLGGATFNALPGNPYSAASQMLLQAVYAWYNADADHAGFFASNNLAAPAAALRELGGFDALHFSTASEDRDLCARWLESGRRMCYVRDALIGHAHSLNLHSFWRQHVAYGRGAFRFRQSLSRRNAPSRTMQPPSYYVHLLRYPFTQIPLLPALHLALLTALSQMASALGYMLERAGK